MNIKRSVAPFIISLSLLGGFYFGHCVSAQVPDIGAVKCSINGRPVSCDDSGGGGGGKPQLQDETWQPHPDALAVYMQGIFGPFALPVMFLAIGATIALVIGFFKAIDAIFTKRGSLLKPKPEASLPPAEPADPQKGRWFRSVSSGKVFKKPPPSPGNRRVQR